MNPNHMVVVSAALLSADHPNILIILKETYGSQQQTNTTTIAQMVFSKFISVFGMLLLKDEAVLLRLIDDKLEGLVGFLKRRREFTERVKSKIVLVLFFRDGG